MLINVNFIVMKYLGIKLCFLFMGTLSVYSYGQEFADSKEKYDSIYNINITLSKINGVYIPENLEDAHRRLLKLTPADAIVKFKDGPEEEVCQKLHFGIGRWMIINWKFYEGSRLSHHLKEKGVLHPDDMAQFILRVLHRYLNKKDLNQEELIETLAVQRKKEAEYLLNR